MVYEQEAEHHPPAHAALSNSMDASVVPEMAMCTILPCSLIMRFPSGWSSLRFGGNSIDNSLHVVGSKVSSPRASGCALTK